jgi:hypothetical protein
MRAPRERPLSRKPNAQAVFGQLGNLCLGVLGFAPLLQTHRLPLAGGLVLHPACLELLLQGLRPRLFGLGLVDVLHKDALVLENITLAAQVQLVVQITVDFLSLPVLAQHVTKHALPPHPLHLLRQTCVARSQPLPRAHVATLTFRNQVLTHART